MLDLMLRCDVCISGGGQTTNELARVGVPAIGINYAKNQELNLKNWQRVGFLDYVGLFDNENILKNIVKALQNLKSFKNRRIKSKIGKRCVDGRGVKRILSNVL